MLVARLIESSEANGPGKRAVVWFQGCNLRCPQCCNPELQPMESESAFEMTPRDLAVWFKGVLNSDPSIRGLTLSGGEPMLPSRVDELAMFLNIARSISVVPFDVMVFTGVENIRHHIGADMYIAGPYDDSLCNTTGIVSSTNQKILRFSGAFDDITDEELINGQRIVEVMVIGDSVVITGLSSIDHTMEIVGLKTDGGVQSS